MKYLASLLLFLFTTISFAQDTGLIVGKVLDKDLNNTPLAFANIALKETSSNTSSDISGTFLLENIKDGNYVLVCNFPGYETKEIEVKISSDEPTEITLALSTFKLPAIEIASKSKKAHI